MFNTVLTRMVVMALVWDSRKPLKNGDPLGFWELEIKIVSGHSKLFPLRAHL